ncbi:MAG: hypothetical protein ACYC6R_00990 [Anaerolineales bacterium]
MNHLAYYVAPEFHTKSGLYESLMQKALLTHSTFWSPRQIGSLSRAERNTLSYKHDSPFGILEPGKGKISGAIKGDALLSGIKFKSEASAEVYDNERLVHLGDQMLENYLKVFHTQKEKRLTSDIWKSRDQIDARDYLSLISILLYGCYVYIIAK